MCWDPKERIKDVEPAKEPSYLSLLRLVATGLVARDPNTVVATTTAPPIAAERFISYHPS